MDMDKFEELLLNVMDSPRPEALTAIKDIIAKGGKSDAEAAGAKLEDLWEDWSARALSLPQAKFALEMASLGLPGKQFFRKILIAAVKVLLPPFLNHAPVIKATGVRDENLSCAEIAERVTRLLALKNGAVLFLEGSRRWGVAGTIDSINASLPMMPFNQVGSNASVPLEIVLKDAVILASGPELAYLVARTSTPVSSTRFRAIVEKRKQVPVSESRMKIMAQCGCASSLDAAAFDKYWNVEAAAPAAAAAAGSTAAAGAAPAEAMPAPVKGTMRRACTGRTLKEVDFLLNAEADASAPGFNSAECAAMKEFFDRLKPDIAKREAKLLASVIALVSDRASGEKLKDILSGLDGKTVFWPAEPAQANYSAFEIWGELSSKLLENLAAVTMQIFGEKYLAVCAIKLPLKALNRVCVHISEPLLVEATSAKRNISADILLWIWKNRKKHKSDALMSVVNLDNVSRLLGGEEPPKAWTAARREMRGMLLDDSAFQGHLIDMLGGDTIMFGSLLQSALFLSSGERQSLMVKLARQSKELQEYLESGAGSRILNAGIGKTETVAEAPTHEPTYTSVKSHKLLMQELDDIINIHVPENREALKTARAHGDFRENSEFDAAKERRNYLSRRRGELERELANIQPVILGQVNVDNIAVIGSEVEISIAGKQEVYFLLGAWDGDPDRKFLSYRTKLGKALMNRKVGEAFTAPDGSEGKVVAVRPLPQEIIAELDV